ncbi:FlaD/FlaE family flagellar protein [Halohasta litorea]|uniref:FlaD/FlaE family flagellar protein n=1 Tax=Halohasta litorea TaxID=869891 RepID=A0ABD6D9T6_9EURY|nr:FlaD/FlaE family flagellar protein [Halohasta litorea]MEA1929937.1 FlaD/FlaE family flagellar protein [Euryarchaeota archaeon]
MTVNPREYDADELRELAGVEPVDEGSQAATPARKPEESIRDEQFRQLLALQSERQQLDQLSRPFLTALPESDLGTGLRDEWLDFLVHVGGQDRTESALHYYRQLRWITPAVEAELHTSVHRFQEPVHDRSLTAGDHRLSLLYIATLASVT